MNASRFRKTPDQQSALALLGSGAGKVLLFGGSRSGKTFILVYALLVRALRAPGSRHIVLRHRANAARCSVRLDTLEKVRRLAFPALRLRDCRTDSMVRLPNGSEIWFGGLDADERADKILGREFATVYFNECSEIAYESVNVALTRLAQKTPLANRAYFDCNPPGKSHWSYRLFVGKTDPVTNLPLPNPGDYASMLMNPAGNRENLPDGYLENTLAALSERQRQRFLEGRWLDDVEGALWTRSMIDRARVLRPPAELRRVVLGVDPAVTSRPESDHTGIVCAAVGSDGDYYVLADASLRGSPAAWARRIVECCREHEADLVVGEVNNGGDLIESLLRTLDADLPFRPVRASRGKLARAEPAAALYEKGRVHHVGSFPELEDEMCSFHPARSIDSPDRLDALVWALTALSGDGSGGGLRFITA